MQALKDTLLVFDAFYDIEAKAKAGNKFAAEVGNRRARKALSS